MAGYNRIIIMGNLTRDPELKQLQSGQPVCRLGIASNRQFKDRQTGNMVSDVCFIDVDVWGPQAESCKQYLQKGRPVLIEGRLKLDSWKDAEGQTRSKHSIVANSVQFLFGSQDQAQPGSEQMDEDMSSASAASAPKKTAARSKKLDEHPFEDELPF
ncbi:TPA: single-stranded DNA-binding protein [Candidatus Dependentiae bacterium]|nr:MAG: Single-stranded DNA-binding protein [candidate division TM6 bacterium GW2011_GWF2_43_87]HBL98639.1 single-stranded DNA-binding protein [Candidatus Dependentiae bacterium]